MVEHRYRFLVGLLLEMLLERGLVWWAVLLTQQTGHHIRVHLSDL